MVDFRLGRKGFARTLCCLLAAVCFLNVTPAGAAGLSLYLNGLSVLQAGGKIFDLARGRLHRRGIPEASLFHSMIAAIMGFKDCH